MKANKYPRIVIAGTQSGVGKTTVSLGIMAALAKKNIVQPFKVGPDYIDPAFHTFITGRKSRNLDSYMLEDEILHYLFQKNCSEADIAVIEGVMGLFDGFGSSSDQGSTAYIAKTLQAPVILVINARGMSRSAAAMVEGYASFDPHLQVAGVILNQVSSESHYLLLKEAIETFTKVKVFGYLPKDAEVGLSSRHLGLVPSGEVADLEHKLGKIAALVEQTIDLAGLMNLAKEWPKELLTVSLDLKPVVKVKNLKLGVAYDKAFNFYYWDNLDLLQTLGVQLEYFSPLQDSKVPENCHGLLFGGGFPEVFAEELETNQGMRESIREALAQGIPYLGECGGLMYLGKEIEQLDGRVNTMVNWLAGHSKMTTKLKRFGYAELALLKDCVLGLRGEKIKIHEFHHAFFEDEVAPCAFKLQKNRSGSQLEWECGYLKGNGIAGFPHLHFYSNRQFAENFVKSMEQYALKQVLNSDGDSFTPSEF